MAARKKSNMSSTLLTIAVVMMCMIFMANAWVSNEIEETKKIGTPAAATSSLSPRTNMLAQGRAGYTRSASLASDLSAEASPAKRTQKRNKIIYEIPLDDVNLVQ